jgi:hypothetical protein
MSFQNHAGGVFKKRVGQAKPVPDEQQPKHGKRRFFMPAK